MARGFITRAFVAAAIAVSALIAATYPQPFRIYRSLEGYDNVELPADFNVPGEFTLARLMYPQHPYARFARGRMDWRQGGTSWSQDYPRADRHFIDALRRLTRIHARSVEQPVNPDDEGDMFFFPMLEAGEMGDWLLTDSQAHELREYFDRGGFMLLDDFWNEDEWGRFMESMVRIFPGEQIVEIDDRDQIFHMVYNLEERYQILGRWAFNGGQGGRAVGTVPRWRGIYDSKGRLMVAMTFNNDVGDSWEWADDPDYPEKMSALGIRWGVNSVVYGMTH